MQTLSLRRRAPVSCQPYQYTIVDRPGRPLQSAVQSPRNGEADEQWWRALLFVLHWLGTCI
jgi:hypothetical protein